MTALFDSPAQSLGEHIARLAAIEAAADTVCTWEPLLIPGLLQTFGYAAAAIQATTPALPLEVVGERADARCRRFDQLGRPGARKLTAVVEESALHRPVGGYATLVDQLDHLLALDALQPVLEIRVLPQGSDLHPGLAGAFSLYRSGAQRAVFVESLTGSAISTRPEDIAAYRAAWDRLTGLALPARESMDLIESVKEALCRRWKTSR
ncbi:DUF5753 domain-containing protein [Streptomyces sp. NPDC101152]|uniref:DUF5753 domain-containing protein n=1 Tax=Streptomyces sp. NPDC101152 TaxID=3366116 RepID=UPI003800CCCD